MKQKKTNIKTILEQALIRRGYRRGTFTIKISPSLQIADITTPKSSFAVYLLEFPEEVILQRDGFAISEDGVQTVELLNIRHLFFHSQLTGILADTKKESHTEYRDEFGGRIWILQPASPIVRLHKAQKQ